MKNVVFLTGSELRHDFMRIVVANHSEINILRTYCEGNEKSLRSRQERDAESSFSQIEHAESRANTEADFFDLVPRLVKDCSNPYRIKKGQINDEDIVNEIISLKPDLLACYGSSIIKSRILTVFKNRFVNLHLGLSPYYRGSGTNFFPLVNGEPEYVGATFMHIDEGIDTGQIIHQVLARQFREDNVHQIGNRLIKDAATTYAELVAGFDQIVDIKQPTSGVRKFYRRKDFTADTLTTLKANFQNGMIGDFLANYNHRISRVEICRQPFLSNLEIT